MRVRGRGRGSDRAQVETLHLVVAQLVTALVNARWLRPISARARARARARAVARRRGWRARARLAARGAPRPVACDLWLGLEEVA